MASASGWSGGNSDIASGVEDPMLAFLVAQGGDEIAPHEDAAVARCEPLVAKVPARS